MPTMIMTSVGDVINNEEIDSLKQLYNVPDEWHMKLVSDMSRASMIRDYSCGTLNINNVILNWVEESVL